MTCSGVVVLFSVGQQLSLYYMDNNRKGNERKA
jgi:hypothetical protein